MAKSQAYYRKAYPYSSIEGFEDVMKNLNRELNKLKGNTVKGMVLAAEAVRKATESTPPITPADLGNLVSSWFVVTSTKEKVNLPELPKPHGKGNIKEGKFRGPKAAEMAREHKAVQALAEQVISKQKSNLMVMMGYTANYAVYVHEGPGGNLMAHFKRPGSGMKWFEAAFTRNSRELLNVIAKYSKIP